MPALILLVNADRRALQQLEAVLSDPAYLVVPMSSFQEAKKLLYSVKPDLLVADIRLHAFNGLHLAARSRIDYPGLPVIITNASPDAVLENEAKRQEATFVVNPLRNVEFLRGVHAALVEHRQAQPRGRQWPRKRVASLVEAQLATSQARIFDMSYGGLRLAFGNQRDLPIVFDVTLPAAGMTVRAHRIWTSRSAETEEFWCGAELVETGASATSDWRDFVDSYAGVSCG
jgi:DNA-binding response OmpR family regulator